MRGQIKYIGFNPKQFRFRQYKMNNNHQFSKQPLQNLSTKHPAFFHPGSLSFAKLYDTPMSHFINGLMYEYSPAFSTIPTKYQASFEEYEKAAKAGDSLACLRLADLYGWANNPFGKEINKEKSWMYMTLACFYSFCTPFGTEIEIRPIFEKFAENVGDEAPQYKKSLANLMASTDPAAVAHKELINELFCYFFDATISVQDRLEKFRITMDSSGKQLTYDLIGAFLMNIYTGDFEKDWSYFQKPEIHTYFNKRIKELFQLYIHNFSIDNDIHVLMLTGFSANVWHYCLMVSKNYNGEIDECILELVRMCKLIINNRDQLGVPNDQVQIFVLIIGWLYRKGIFFKQNIAKSLLYFMEIEDDTPNPNLLYEKARVKDKLGMTDEAYANYEKIKVDFTPLYHQCPAENLLPYDHYLMGFLEEKISKDKEKAKEFYAKGTKMATLPVMKPFEALAYQRKCIKKLEKLGKEKADE